MSIASAITAAQGKVSNAYTVISNKGGTLPQTQNLTNLATAIDSIPSDSGKYTIGDVISDERSGMSIGMISGFFTDNNGIEYAILCGWSRLREQNKTWRTSSSYGAVTNMPMYYATNLYESKETGLTNYNYIKQYDNKSPLIAVVSPKRIDVNGVRYQASIPNVIELIEILKNQTLLDNSDPAIVSSRLFSNNNIWTSTQYYNDYAWIMTTNGTLTPSSKDDGALVVPIFEIPNR